MAWTVRIAAKEYKEGRGILTLAFFNNGVGPMYETLIINAANANTQWLKNALRSRITQLNDSETFTNSIVANPSVDYDTTATPPTQAELDLAAFRNDCLFLRRADKGVRAGVFTGSEALITSAKTRIHDNMALHVNDADYQAALDTLP